jgi:hypothetical protein
VIPISERGPKRRKSNIKPFKKNTKKNEKEKETLVLQWMPQISRAEERMALKDHSSIPLELPQSKGRELLIS